MVASMISVKLIKHPRSDYGNHNCFVYSYFISRLLLPYAMDFTKHIEIFTL